jgi:hypothetical protein
MVHIRPDELVASALRDSDAGIRDADNAAKHGVTVKTIRRWRRLYQRGGLPRGQSHTIARCPRCEGAPLDAAAYAELFGWYLGDGWLENHRNRGVFALHIFNDARYVELNARIVELMRTVKPGARPHIRSITGAVNITVNWRHWPCLLPQHGPGRKHDRKLTLESWQQNVVDEHPAAFLRGLFHSDGCRVDNWATREVAGETKRYEYGRWQFVTTRRTSKRSAPTRSTASTSRGGSRPGGRSRSHVAQPWRGWTS